MEGQRIAKKEGGGGKLPWIITGSVVGVLAAAYIGTCAWASGRDAILPNVSVAGIDVSNMTVEQARDTVQSALDRQSGDVKLEVVVGDQGGISARLMAADVDIDAGQSAQNALEISHGNFFAGGPQLVGHMMGMSSETPLVIPENDPAVKEMLDDLARQTAASSENSGYEIDGEQLTMVKGAPILTVDWGRAEEKVRDTLQQELRARFRQEEGIEMRVQLQASQSQNKDPDFEAIHREVYTEAKDASLDLESMEITDHAVGMDFDVQTLKTAYQKAGSGETVSVPLTITRPKVTKEDLGGQLFKDLLGEGTTRVSGSANRKSNVKLAAEACNEKILLPGEEFSYNSTTGSRTADKGYKNAPIYQQGQSVDDIGGGICQTSSTIYYAVLHTNLEVVERHCHQFNTGYVDMGMDATVFYGSLDFRFKNSTDYPIKIVTNSYDSNGNRYLNVKIYGTNPEGVYAVPKSSIFDKVAPTTVYTPDPSVPQGTLVLDRQQYAYTGWSAHTYRYVYDKDGNEIAKQDMGPSKYKMRPNTYHYNPADGDPSTWVNGKPGTTTDPGAAVDPGTTTTPPTDPGTTTPPVDPGTTTPPMDPGTTVPPIDPGTTDPVTPPSADTGIAPVDPGQMAG